MLFHLIALNCRYSHSCLALFYVRNALEKNLNTATRLSQLTINDPYFETLLALSEERASHLCFSVYIWNADYVERLVHDLAAIQPSRPILLGGPQAPFLENLPPCCSIIQGEVEGMPQDFYEDLRNNRLQPCYQAENGHPFALPYTPDDYTVHLKHRNIYYESTRGCPFSCSYCLSSTSRGINALELDQVKQELQTIVQHHPQLVKFVDRTFNADANRSIAIWQFLLELETPTRFHFEIAPDLFTEEMFSFLERVPPNIFQFEIGVQSTNPMTLASVNRRMDIEQAQKNIARLMTLNTIHLHLDLILGLPGEDKASFGRSLQFVCALKPHYIQMGLLKVLPATPIRAAEKEYGLLYRGKPPYQILQTNSLHHQELRALYALGECLEAFYNNRYFRLFFTALQADNIDFFTFFTKLSHYCNKGNFPSRAKTQPFLNELLVGFLREWSDQLEWYREILTFDWLSCGHRTLPKELSSDSLNEIRNHLWQTMPENKEPLYCHRDRNNFFKKGVFFRFSKELLTLAALKSHEVQQGGYVCFLPKTLEGVFKRAEVVFLKESEET